MNDSLLHSLCESRHRKLIVAIVTTLLALLVLLPVTDDYFDKRESRRTLTEDLDRARDTEKLLPAFERRVVAMEENVAVLKAQTVSEESISQYRTKLLELIQSAGCQMRRLDVEAPTRQPWIKGEDPMQTIAAAGTKRKTSFQLERHNINMSIDGDMTSIHSLLDLLDKDKTIAYPRRLHLHSNRGRSTDATLDMELWLFALVR